MGEPLILIHVIVPVSNLGDVMGRLNSLGAWLENATDSDPTHVTARIPQESLPKFEKWLSAWLPSVAQCIVVAESGSGKA